eukprot:scaffold5535_cov188-Prasinococcus_capsulatus_cf.AAC.1
MRDDHHQHAGMLKGSHDEAAAVAASVWRARAGCHRPRGSEQGGAAEEEEEEEEGAGGFVRSHVIPTPATNRRRLADGSWRGVPALRPHHAARDAWGPLG